MLKVPWVSCWILLLTSRVEAQRMRVYPQNPQRTPATQVLNASHSPEAGTLTSRWIRVKSCIMNGKTPGSSCRWASVAKADASGTFLYEPRQAPENTADPFAEVSAYFHADRALAYFQSLGLLPDALAAPVELLVGARFPLRKLEPRETERVVSQPRAFYLSPADPLGQAVRTSVGTEGPLIWLGFGKTADTAYAGDLIAHEMTHAVLDRGRVPQWAMAEEGANGESLALAEALADYFAAAITEDPLLGESVVGPGGRDLRSEQERSFDTGVAHEDGQRLARCLWRTRSRLRAPERERLDRQVFRIALQPNQVRGLQDFAAELRRQLSADRTVVATLNSELKRTRLLDRWPQVLNITPLGPEVPPGVMFEIPGRRAFAKVVAVPSVLQFRIAVPDGAKKLRGSLDAHAMTNDPWSPLLPASERSPSLELVACFNSRIQWAPDGQLLTQRCVRQPYGRTLSVPLPREARAVFVQVVNTREDGVRYARPLFSFVE